MADTFGHQSSSLDLLERQPITSQEDLEQQWAMMNISISLPAHQKDRLGGCDPAIWAAYKQDLDVRADLAAVMVDLLQTYPRTVRALGAEALISQFAV